MTPTKFNGAYTRDLPPCNNPNTGELPRAVCIDRHTPGVVAILSCWEPSVIELEEIVRTGKVYVAVMAPFDRPTQAPIWVLGANPIESGQFTVVPEEDLKYLGGQDRPIL
jgi:hypothetical protein